MTKKVSPRSFQPRMSVRRYIGKLLRRSPVAEGIFYPGNRESLRNELAFWGLEAGGGRAGAGGNAILAPHGAWKLTGNIAAAAFASVRKRAEEDSAGAPGPLCPSGRNAGESLSRVILLGPIHQAGEDGVYLSESSSFKTPLGDLRVDKNLNRELASRSPRIKVNDIPHLSEHSLEVLLPLVKYCFPEVKIVPVLMRGRAPSLVSALAGALGVVLGKYMKESLIVISSQIAGSGDPVKAFYMAEEFTSLLESMDAEALLAALEEGRISACGTALTAALLESGLLEGKSFSSLTPLTQGTDEQEKIVYYRAFATGVK